MGFFDFFRKEKNEDYWYNHFKTNIDGERVISKEEYSVSTNKVRMMTIKQVISSIEKRPPSELQSPKELIIRALNRLMEHVKKEYLFCLIAKLYEIGDDNPEHFEKSIAYLETKLRGFRQESGPHFMSSTLESSKINFTPIINYLNNLSQEKKFDAWINICNNYKS